MYYILILFLLGNSNLAFSDSELFFFQATEQGWGYESIEHAKSSVLSLAANKCSPNDLKQTSDWEEKLLRCVEGYCTGYASAKFLCIDNTYE